MNKSIGEARKLMIAQKVFGMQRQQSACNKNVRCDKKRRPAVRERFSAKLDAHKYDSVRTCSRTDH